MPTTRDDDERRERPSRKRVDPRRKRPLTDFCCHFTEENVNIGTNATQNEEHLGRNDGTFWWILTAFGVEVTPFGRGGRRLGIPEVRTTHVFFVTVVIHV